jgi:hypothetical protein
VNTLPVAVALIVEMTVFALGLVVLFDVARR